MHPILIEIFGLRVSSYGFTVALGFLAGMIVFQSLGPRRGIPQEKSQPLFVWLLLSGILGARLLYVLVDWAHFRDHPLEILMIWRGGLVLYGSLLFASTACWIYALKNKIALFNLADILAPCTMLGIFIGRWGCLLVGDCYGKEAPSTLPWAITFPYHKDSLIPADLVNVPLHPAQIYMSLNGLLLFCITLFILRRRRFEGQVFLAGTFLYALSRGIIELYRGDNEARGYWGPLSTSQWISVGIMVCVPVLYGILWMKARRSREVENRG